MGLQVMFIAKWSEVSTSEIGCNFLGKAHVTEKNPYVGYKTGHPFHTISTFTVL